MQLLQNTKKIVRSLEEIIIQNKDEHYCDKNIKDLKMRPSRVTLALPLASMSLKN